MVGQFNEVIVKHASNELEANQRKNWHCSVLSVGLRVFSRLEEAGQSVEQWVPLPGSVSAITSAVQDMVVRLEAWQTQKNIERIVLFHNKPVSGASYEPQTIHLLPVDLNWFHDLEQEPWPSRSLPQFTINWGSLFSSLVREYLFKWRRGI
jgi:F-type H+-transporting ATPase subunit gamma